MFGRSRSFVRVILLQCAAAFDRRETLLGQKREKLSRAGHLLPCLTAFPGPAPGRVASPGESVQILQLAFKFVGIGHVSGHRAMDHAP